MRILGARISLGGKIQNFQTDTNDMENFFKKETAHAYFKRPYFFLSLLAGKLDKIEQLLP